MAEILTEQALRRALMEGCEALWRVAGPIYGASGRSVWFTPKYDIPMAVKSLRELLPELHLEDPIRDFGLRLVCDAAQKVSKAAGCGTATSVVLAQAILAQGAQHLAAGVNPMQLREGILQGVTRACKVIRAAAQPAGETELQCVMQTAVPDARAVRNVLDAARAVGPEGVITIEDSQRAQTCLEAGGIRYDYGYASKRFSNDATGQRAMLDAPYILLADEKLESILPLQKLLVEAIEQDAQVLIIAREFGHELLADLLSNVKQGVFRLVAAIAPEHGEVRRRSMQALALACGAKLWTKELGLPLEACGLEICGRAGRAEIGKEYTAIFDAQGRDQAACEQMLRSLRRAQADQPEQAEQYALAISILTGGGARILAGGTTEIEMFECKRNMEQALAAMRSAQRGGVVPGGGTAYLAASRALELLLLRAEGDRKYGLLSLREALYAPAALLAENAGESGTFAVQKILARRQAGYGYDCVGRRFCDLRRAGILDPAEGVCLALETAAETACSILTASAGILRSK